MLHNLYLKVMSEWLEAFLVIEAILINCILVTFYGLSGLFKEHMDYLFVKKKKNDVNSGAKFG